MAYDIDLLTRTPDLRALPDGEAQIVSALRLWVVMTKLGRCPFAAMEARLGSQRATAGLYVLLETIGAAWAEPFCVAPPCCPRLSHDETLVLDMLRLAGTGDRVGFDWLLSDLLPGDHCDRLFGSATLFVGTLQRRPAAL